MACVIYSRRAEADLVEIARYTSQKWGVDQADRYIGEIEDCCRQLAASPDLGRAAQEIAADLRRLEHGKHVVFYRPKPRGILVSRILHRSMLPKRHAFNPER